MHIYFFNLSKEKANHYKQCHNNGDCVFFFSGVKCKKKCNKGDVLLSLCCVVFVMFCRVLFKKIKKNFQACPIMEKEKKGGIYFCTNTFFPTINKK